jgi:uncharacterized protein YecE (DUF72 family)
VTVRIGLSGWSYPEWKGEFYPAGLGPRRQLAHLAGRFPTVELNASFYRLQRPASYQRWAAQTPDDFVFAVKGGRFVTHVKRLRSPEALANFFASGVLALGAKLGPLLWQFPANLHFDAGSLAEFLAQLPRGTGAARVLAERTTLPTEKTWLEPVAEAPLRHAVEARHESYRDPAFAALLAEHEVASVVSDSAGAFPCFEEVAGPLAYVRLHGATELYTSEYGRSGLRRWLPRLRRWADGRDLYVYFDNTAAGAAPRDAALLTELLG